MNGGILMSEARHLLFLKDTDGDGKADLRKVILPGWGVGDSHAMQTYLSRGFDNWLYGEVGYSNFRGNVDGKELQFGQSVFRFKADGSALEFLHQFNNNTWGFGLNAHGDAFGSTANGHPTFYGYLPAHILNPTQPGFGGRGGGGGGFRPGYRLGPDDAGNGNTAQVRRLPSAKSLAPGMRMHPNTPNVRMVDIRRRRENEVKVTTGDPKRGEDLFFNSPTAACAACHQVGGKGGDIGPILDGIAVRGDRAYILESLMNPNAKLAKGFENLPISPMPLLGALLKEQELEDILAFLATLKTPPKGGITVPARKVENHE